MDSIMTFADLPRDVLDVIGAHLGLKDTWRSVDEVVRDQAALAMASRLTEPLAEILAADLAREALDVHASGAYKPIAKPVVPDPLDDIRESVGPASSMRELREAARRCGVPCARSKADLWARVSDALRDRQALVRERAAQLESFENGPANQPVLANPVPERLRARVLEPQCLTATGARDRFVLTDRDLRGLPCALRTNPYSRSAAPMRLYRISDLRTVAERKHGGIEFIEGKRAARVRRGATVSEALQRAKGEREAALTEALRSRGCELRDDSRLCSRYIDTGRGDVDDIANTMAEMRFCFAHTRYLEILDDNIQSMRDAGERFDFYEETALAREQAIDEYVRNGRSLHLLPAHLRDVR